MSEWRWSDPGWRERVGVDPQALIREALRRAVDIRDQGSEGTGRAVFLVDVLNALCDAMEIEVGDLWAV